MTTDPKAMQALIERITAMPEIELQEFFEGISGHIERNDLEHVVTTAFGPPRYSDVIQRFEERLEEAEEEKIKANNENNELREKQLEALECIDRFQFEGDPEDAYEDLQEALKTILK